MENYEWKKASDELEELTKKLELVLSNIKLSHIRMEIKILKNNYLFEKKEKEYKKRINELEEQLNDKRYKHPIIDVEVE